MTDTDLPIPAADVHLPLAPVALEVQRSLLDAWSSWLADQVALHQYSEFTRIGYLANIRHWFAHLERVARTDRPTAGTVQSYVQALIASGREPATVNLYLNTVKSFYRWCETEDRYPAIARSIRTLREFRDGPLPALSHDQIVALVTGIPEDTLLHCRDRAMIALMYATAFRSISIVRSDVEDLDMDRLAIVHQPKGHIAKDTQAAIPGQWPQHSASTWTAEGRHSDRPRMASPNHSSSPWTVAAKARGSPPNPCASRFSITWNWPVMPNDAMGS